MTIYLCLNCYKRNRNEAFWEMGGVVANFKTNSFQNRVFGMGFLKYDTA